MGLSFRHYNFVFDSIFVFVTLISGITVHLISRFFDQLVIHKFFDIVNLKKIGLMNLIRHFFIYRLIISIQMDLSNLGFIILIHYVDIYSLSVIIKMALSFGHHN